MYDDLTVEELQEKLARVQQRIREIEALEVSQYTDALDTEEYCCRAAEEDLKKFLWLREGQEEKANDDGSRGLS
jgi:hypothetical protein